MPAARPLDERFHEKYQKVPFSGCWLWTGALDTDGYGMIAVGRGPKAAHRISWILHKGEIPLQQHVLHHCDIPCCVNPAHLFLGTHADNMKDGAKKGRIKPPDWRLRKAELEKNGRR